MVLIFHVATHCTCVLLLSRKIFEIIPFMLQLHNNIVIKLTYNVIPTGISSTMIRQGLIIVTKQ